ncbi:tandem-95 repeat protein [Vibrio sp. 1CM8B]|uniref:tandem-95 repeat protein n=2 Tax=unclassified Vibrio TaxID=2614977 RepID=UPI0020BF80F8|nr:tandem-95 repeat protein [Vibrio sp. 1CM8B]MCK8085260.1 tandem-95 repeat protein [Vibrio sp. 1CM8B]
MAGENNQNNQNEDLNDAVEQTDTNDAGTPSQQQNQQNQQNTIASTIATGAENTDAADEVNQALDENPSGAGNAEDASASGAAVQEETPESDGDSDAAQSNVVGGAASEAGSDNAAGSGGGAGAGAQAVGGDNAEAATGGADAEGNDEQGQAARTSAAPSATSSESGDQQVGDDLDSQTVEETFAVDVQASDEETISEVEDDFDSETVSETFKIKVESENDAPEAEQDLAYIMDEDGSITFTQEQLLEYASDVDGDELVASNVQVGADATVQDNGDGTFTVVPSADFNGELDLTFDISDGQETISSAIDLTVRPINDAPVPEDKTFEIEEDGTLVFTDADLLSGATDIEGDNLTVEGITYEGTDGVLTDLGDGSYSFAPNENFNGDVNFSFDVSDGTDTVSANIDVSVTPENDPPVAGSTSYSVNEDNSITISDAQLLATSSDIEGDVSIDSVTYSGSDGVLEINGNGTYTFSPNENFSGEIALDVVVADEDGATDATTAGINVLEVNDPPVAGPTSYTIDEDSVLTFSESQVLLNASDVEGDVELVGISYDGPDGIFSVNGDGTCSFAPNENFNGQVQLDVTIRDEDGAEVETVINVDVLPINDAPVSGDLAYNVNEDGSITLSQEQLLSQASDVEGEDLTASGLTVGGDATVVANDDGSFTITPDENFNGDIDISFDISDGTNTVQASADLTVNPVNDLPVPQDQQFSVEEDGTLIFTDADLLTGATDIEGDNLTVEGVTYDGGDGILTDNGNGTYTFAPNENFNGDVNFGFDVSDGTDTVSANIDVSVTAVDDAPVSGDLAYSIDEDGSIRLSQEQLLSQASDVEGDDLTASGLTVGGDATVVANDDGSFTITPDENFNGDIDISFDISDGTNTVQASADLTVNPVNDLPVPQDQQFSVEEDGTLIFTDADLLTGATDIEGDNLTVEGVTYDGGDGILTDNGNGTYTFAPNENFNGDVNFGFDVSDGTDTVSANIDVSVTAVDDAPVSGDLAYSIDEDGSIRLSQEQLLSQASDVEGDDLTASDLTVGGDATVVANDDGSFTITPDENFNGDIDISFDISDGTNTVQASADLTVNPVNDLPVPQDQQFSVEEDGTLIFTDADLLTGATDIEGDNLTVEGVTYDGGDGILTDNGNGTYTFAPNENFNGDVNFGFDVSDGTDTVSANIDVSVTAVDDAPVSGDLAYSIDEDGSIRLSQEQLLSQASDVEGDDLTASSLTVGSDATVVANDDGSFTITPDENFNGDIDISFDISDGTNTVQASADLTVNPVNDLPVPQDQQFSIAEDGTLLFTDADLLTGATDIEGDNLTVEGITYEGTDGVLTDLGEGSYSFAPNENFNGDVSFSFDVSDGTDTVSANIDVSVTPENDPPVAGSTSYTVNEDNSITISDAQLLATSSDIEGDVSIDSVTYSGSDGVLEINGNGTYTFSPNENFSGEIALDVVVADEDGATDATTAGINVLEVNDPPVAGPTSYTIDEDSVLTFSESQVLLNASDVEGDVELVGISYDGPDGIFSVNGDGTCSFAPNENFNGQVQLDVTIRDEDGAEVETVINVDVLPINDAPVSGDLAYNVNEDGSITLSQEQLLSQASDVEGEDLTASDLTIDGNATVTANDDGSFTIVPDANFNGDIDIQFNITDGTDTVQATADLTVNPVNDLPVPQDQQFSIAEDGTLQFTDADLLTGATDIDGDDLTVEGISYTGGDGVLTDHGDGTYTFAPNENFNGDVNFSFDVSDGTETVSANIDVSVTPENDPPVAGSTSYMVNEDNAITISDEQLLANSSDVEGAVSVDSVTYSGTDGVFQDNGDGSYTFLPNENFSGDISLDVIVADEDGSIDETTAGITVLEVNDPPVAGPTSYTIDEDSVLTFSESQILVNASDVEGDVELVGINYDGSDGIFTVNGDGTCSFAPNENFNGQVQLGVTIQDEDGAKVETHINVDVLPINDAPVSGDLAYTINEDSSITLSQEQLLARAGDIDSDNLEAINLSTDENATIQHNDDGSYTITPNADYNGDLDLNFDIIDNDGGSVQVGLDITVNPVNDLPQAQDQQFTIEEDGTLLFTDADLLAGASDIDGDELSIENVLYTGADGVLSDNGDGTYSFAPNENFNGDVQFSFDVSDGTDSTSAVIDVSVTPENDPPVAGSTSYTVQEDGQITISDGQLLANSSDVEGDVSLSGVTYSGDDGSFVDNGNGTYTFTPNENFDGDISLDVVVIDEDGATATTTAGIDVIAVNDGPETSGIQAEVDEDNAITITQEQLLANATDVEGDDLTASNLQTNDPDATIVANDDGSFTITHTENFNGELDFTYNISDGENEVLTTLDLTVNPVNDAPEAGDEIFIQAQEDQTVGVTLREEPALRLDQAPENGIIEANVNDEWVVLEVGQEVPADTEVRFIPNDDALANGTHTTQIGTFDDNASVDDWGTEVDPYTREFSDGDLTVTVQSNDDPLGAWNGNTHIGHGIGDTDRQGLSGDEKLTVSVEGQDINEISFHLDGLGGWFMEESRHFTEVEIRAFNDDGELIDSMTYHKEDRSNYETDYTLTVNEPVSYFELGTVQGNGTYVVQNMTVSQTCHDEAVFTSIGVDGSEITETVELNIHAGDNEIELTAELPNITVDTDGSAQFASVVITEEQLLAQASDIDGDDLDIQNLELVGENSEHATLTDNGDGTWTVTPDENFHGEIELGYQVTDGELTDSNIININFESVNDAPIVSGPIVLSTDEDEGITFSADDLLANTTDVEGDTLSISDITYGGDNGELVDNGDGTFTFMPNENFNGEIDIDYKVFDGTDEVATHLDLTVVPVNDVPVPGEPLHTQMLENGSMIIEAKDLLSGATDVDGDILHVENLLLADQTQGTLTDNGDNTFTFEPAEDFYGEVNLTFDISDGQASAPSTARVDVEIVNEGPEVSGPIEAAVDEDGSITITQEELLANATDVDGDNLEAVNFATNDPNAVVVENPDGSFTITPSADFFGEIEFTYDVTDAIETVAADLNLTVNPINDAPDVPDMSFTTEDGQAITITEAELLAQATDVEGDELSVVNVTSASDTVEVTDNGDGTYTLTPEQGFFGNVDLAFDVSDGTDVVAANIDLKVEFVNDAPEATPMVADVDEDGSILVTQEMLLENASDQDGDELFASALETNDPNASIVDNGDGTYTVTPSENFNGDIAFTYEVSDGELSTSNDMTLTVNPVNDIPIVAPGMYHIEEDGSILFTQEDLLSGAIDIDGDDLSVTSINYSGDEGTVTDNGDGTFSFVPEEHFSGDLQFSFTVTDGTDEVEQDINVHIEAVADAPDLVITDGDGVNVDDEAILVEPGGIVELNIAAALVDQDLSETLTVTVDGVPEGSVITYDNEGVINNQDNGITSYNDTEITVTFEGETAGYENTAGYYKVDEDGNITGVEIVYENASQVDGGGDLVPGQEQFSFQVAEGESFNLFLIPNGHQHNDFDAMQDGQYEFRAEDGSPANMDTVDPQLVFVAADGTETVIQGQNGDAIFHGGSSSQLNQDGIEHTRTTVNEDGELVYGFEDLYGGGDADYTDFNFTIDVGEVNSQIYSGEVTVGPDGTVNLPTTAIENALQIQLPEDFNEQLEVHVTATATELSNDDSETVSQTIYINATGAHIEHAPEALPVSATVEEDGSIIITQEDLLANARDLDGDQLTALNLATDDESVTITDNGDGTYTLTPDADFNGDVSFTFDVSDGDDVVSTNLELTVSPVNDGPEAQDQTFTVGEDGVLTFNDQDLLTGATDIEGDDLSVEGVTYTGADGVLTDNGDGTYSFAPNENFNGDVNFSFNVSDGTDTITANIDVNVTPENDPPVAGSTSYTVHEDNSITISNEQLLANSSDIEGEVAIDNVTYSGSDGVLEINGDGTYTFSPNENFNGEVSLDVVVVDEDDAAVSTTAGITVLEVNDPPVAGPTSYTIDEDSVLTFSESQVLLNASDIEGDVELVEINYDGPDGIFSINGDGTCSFAPNENFNGQVQLDVTIQDEDGAQVDTFITVDVLPINDVPVSGDLAYSVEEDGSITLSQAQLLSQASDVDGDDLTASNLIVDGDATVVTNDDGSFTITPDANFNGDIDLNFDITDGDATLQATADLTVNPVNDLPTVGEPQFVTQEDTSFTFTEEQLLQNAGDIDGDNLSVENVASDSGTLVDNGDGTYTFAPNENFDGNVNVTFDVNDGTATVPAEATIDVQSVVDMPELSIASDLVIASDNFESGSNGWNTGTESSQGFESGDMLGRIGGTGGDEAVSKTYDIPNDVSEVNISFNFYEIDSWDGESFQIFVGGEELTSLDNSAFQTQDGTTTLYDSAGNEVGEVVHGVSQGEGFSGWNDQAHQINLTVPVEDGQLELGFGSTLNQGVSDESFGIDNIEITVSDADYQIIGTEDTPVPLDIDAALTDTDGSENLAILIEDVPEGSSLSAGTDNGDGTWSLQPGELEGLEFIPSGDFNGDVVLTVNATSTDVDTGTTATATQDVTIHISPANDAPEVDGDISAVTAEDNSITLTQEQLLEHAVDIDGDDLSAINLTTNDENATVQMNDDGSFTITPSENFNGNIEFSYDVTDGEDMVAAGLDLTVTPVNDAPELQDQAFTIGEDGVLNFTDADLLTGATDVEGDDLTVEGVTYTGADGVLTDNGDGSYSFAPNENFNGDVNFSFDVSDGTDTVQANIDVSVTPENDPPVAGSTSYTVHEDNSITISNEQLLANSSDIEGEVAIDSVTYTGSDGVFEDNGDGTYTFSPNENFNGDVSLAVVVTDEEGATEATTVGITVLEVNDPPIAGSTSYSVNEDEVITISAEQLLANSSDIEGEVAIDSVTYTGADGIFTDNGNGTFSFAPNANFDGDVSLDVVVTDEDGATVATNASIDVLPINDPPVSGDLAYSIDEDGSITLTQEQLLSQASDVDGDDLTASNLSAGDNATVVDNGDGTFTVTPDANFNGDIDLSFDISDGTESIVANADLTVNPVNDLPTTSDVYANVDEDNVITITQEQLLANAADIEGDDLVASDLTLVGDDATIVDNGDGTFSITPSENFNGYIDVAYSISDGDTPIAANLGLTVDPVNDAPIVSADVAITIEEDGSYTITQEELLQFATDIEDDDMTAIIGEQGDETTVTGTVLDAETSSPVSGAEVTLTDSAGNSYTTVTDDSGNYSVTGSVVDQGTVTIEQEGSITSSFLVPAGEDVNGGVTAISEVLEETDMRIVVTWGESPRDMDNHLWLYDTENGNELDHIYYRDMSHDLGEGNVVQQDVDDVNGHGPETITIPNYQDADMHYSVHNYTNRSWDVDGVEDVQVQVFVGDTLVETFSPDLSDNPSGDHWHVFDIVNGIIVPSQDVGTQNAFDLPTAEEALANENGIDISELLTGDEGDDSGDTGGNEPSVGDVSIENALITDNGDGTYTITPEENFNGEFSISYNVDDGNGGVTPAELDVTVTAVNDLSVIYDHDYTINEDGSLTFTDEQLLAGATDIDGDDLSVESVNYEGTDGVFTDNGDGTYTFAPNENFNGNVDLTYDVSDGTDVVSANIDVQVVPINDVPVAGSTTCSVEEDGSITLSDAQLLANSSDVEGEVFVSDVSYSGTDGVFTDNGDGTYTFAPNENFNGDISLDVSVMDEDGAIAETTAGIDVIAVNDLPVAGSTTYSVDEDNVITINEAQLLANSSDIEGDVSVSDVSYSGADGIFTDNGDGTYSFAPNENFNGNVSLDVTVADEDGATAQTTAGIDVIAVNDAPVSGDLAYSVDEDGSITLSQEQLLAQASDVDGDDLTAANLTAGDNATVTENDDGSFTITPDADFNGDIDLSFDLSDGTETVVATADLTVNPVNDIAVVEDVAYTIEEDGSLTFTDEQLLAGASDIDGDELSVADVSYTGAEGVFTDNGDGTYTFAPNENFNGDVSLDFSVSDGTETVDANIDVTVTDVNDAPVAGATSYQMNEDGTITLSPEQLIANSSDVDGEVSLDSVSYSGADGILVQNEDGSVTFAPNENFNGDINLDVTVIDDDGATAQTTAGIEVIAVNDAPVAGNVAYSVDEDGSITLSQEQLLANASDVDGDALTASNLSAGDNATVTANEDGSFTIMPDADINGDIDLSFDVSDGLETVQAGVDLTVNPVNDLPTAEDQNFTVEEDGTLIFTDADLLAGAADIDGDDLSITDVSYTGAEGVFTDNGDGTYSFAPNENFNGDVNLGFTVTDGTETVDANIGVTVTDVNDAPVAGSTSYQMNEDGTITISPEQLIANSSDVDGEVSLESVTYTGSDGTLVQNDNGSVTFTPNENFNGDISLDVVVTDDDGATATTTAGIEVLAVNDGPESEDVKLTTAEDSTILITQDMLLAQATDIDNTADELSASGLQIDPSLGELLDNEDGTWSFTPNENFNGDVPMTFNVSDGQETISVDGNIDVTPVNDAPEAPTIEMQGEEDVVMVIDPAYIAGQVTDLDGDEISIESITVRAPANATLTQQPDGMYHLVTTQDFNGLVELGYQATDGEEVVDGSLNVDVIPVNDAPFNVGNAMMTTNEDGAFTFDAGDLMNLFGDIDTADLVVSRIITADGEDGGEVTDNGDGTWTFTPTGDFSGVSDLQVVVSDGEFETVLDVPVFVRPVADGAVITTDHDGPLVFGEDETGHLGLNVGLVDDSETLSNLVMTGFPVGFEVTDGVNTVMITEPGQYIDLFDWDISNIQMTPPEDFHGEFFVTVSATTVDYGDEPEAFDDGIDTGDFETVAGDSIILTADDLIGLAENVDADSDDEVKLVHLADRSQGEIVDNGDGTWTFTPAPGFTGEADIAYVVDKDGVLHDEQTGVVVKEGDSQENAAPEVNSITTTEIAADATLSFTDEDMLANLSDAEGDSLSIESVSLMEGQGVIESDNQGNYQFTPAEDYTGDVQVGFIATDGENRIESFFNVDIHGGDEAAASEGYALADDGSLTITDVQLVDELGVSDSAQVVDVADANDAGFFAESGEGEWTYWPNEDFDGNLAMNVEVNDGGEVSSHSVSIQVADESVQSDEPQVQAAQATEEQQVEVAQQADDQAQDAETEDSTADVTAAPGDTISISIPDEVSGNESVDYADMSGLPEGATVSNALDNGDGSFTISGNLEQPVSVELPEGYEGTSEIQFQGYDELGSSIDGASGSVEVEVDDQYTMQGSTQEQQPDMAGMESGGSDWTSAGGQDQGVDFTDDSGSFDSDSQTGTDQGNDFDQSSI